MESIEKAVAGSAEKCVEEWCRKVATPAKIGLEKDLVEDLQASKKVILQAVAEGDAPAEKSTEFVSYCDAILDHFRSFREVVDELPARQMEWKYGKDSVQQAICEEKARRLKVTQGRWSSESRGPAERREYKRWTRCSIFRRANGRSRDEFKADSLFAELSEGVMSHNKNLRTEFESDILDRDETRMIREVVGDVVEEELEDKGKTVTPIKLALVAAKQDASSSELAEIVGMTASGVRQIQRRTLDQLRPEVRKRLEAIDPDVAAGLEVK